MKMKLSTAWTEVKKAAHVAMVLAILVALTRSAVVTWYNDSDITGLPVDRIVAGIVLTVVFSYFVWLHYKKK